MKDVKILIRPLQMEDLKDENFYKTLERLSPSPKPDSSEKYNNLIQEFGDLSKTARCFVALKEKKIVGAITVWLDSRIPRGNQKIALIEDLAVRKDFEGLGIGHSLMKEAIDFSRKMDCQRIRLVCKPELEEFYKKFGFNTDGISMRQDLKEM